MTAARPLRAAAKVLLGRQRSPKHETGDHPVPYLRAANVNDGWLSLDDVYSMNFTPAEQRRFQLRHGDVLVTEGSGSLSQVGQSAVWSGELDGVVCFQNTLLRLRPRQGTDGRFLAWWARHAFASGMFAAAASGANIYHLSAERLRSLPVVLPAPASQRAIADFLDAETAAIDALLHARRRSLVALASRRSAVIDAGVSGRFESTQRRRSSLAWMDSVPVHWREAMVKLIARLGSGHTPSRSRPEWWIRTECTIPWITTGEVSQMRTDRVEFIAETREQISPLGLANSSAELCPPGTVVLCRTASAGFSAIMGTEMATSQDFVTWVCGPKLRPRYLLLCLRAMRPDLLGRLAMGSTHKTIYMPDVESIRVPLPPVEEQDTIVNEVHRRLDGVDRAMDALERQVRLLEEHRQALITAAVTGQIDARKAA